LQELKGDGNAHVVAKKRGYSAPDDLAFGVRSSGGYPGLARPPSRHRQPVDPDVPENDLWNKQNKVRS
jgi:hypothetical protein